MKPSASRTLLRSTFALAIAATLLSSGSFAQTNAPTNQPATKPVPCAFGVYAVKRDAAQPLQTSTPPPCIAKHHSDTSISLGAY